MKFIVVKRIVIISTLIISLFTLNYITEENLLSNLPTESDVLAGILQKQEQEAKMLKDLDKAEQERFKNEQILLDELLKEDEPTQENDYLELFDNSVRHTFIFEFTSSEFDNLIQDMEEYNAIWGPFSDRGLDYRSNNYRRINITYIDSLGKVYSVKDVGIRTKGNIWANGRRLPIDDNGNVREAHYMLKFNETFDYLEGSDEYKYLKSREVFDLEQLLFKWNNSSDPAYSNEVYSMKLFEDNGVVAPKASMAEVQISIDGKIELKSLYNIFEHVDEEFIRRYFENTPTKDVGDLYKIVPQADLTPIFDTSIIGVRDWESGYRPSYGKETNKDVYDYSSLVDFTNFISYPDLDQRKQYFDDFFDTERFINSMALNVLLGNPDDYRGNLNNYYVYIGLDGSSYYIPYDYDNSIGIGWPGMGGLQNFTLGYDIYDWGEVWDQHAERPLTDHILEYDEFRLRYEYYLEYYIDSGIFSYEKYQEFVEQVDTLYGDSFDIFEDRQWYFNQKINEVKDQLDYYKNLR